MGYIKFMLVFVVLFVNIEAEGHGEKHHNHVRVHVPKFVHHDHHTKTITIHHHHHKPKKEHHHHHHHHHKPKAPEGHHYHHHHKKTSTHSVSKGQSSHGNQGHHGYHSKHGHHGHQGHHGHEHKHDDAPLTYDSPSIHYKPSNYEPPSVNYGPSISYNPTFASEEDFGFRSSIPSSPQLHGVVHTVKETKVFDSLPNAFSGTAVGNLGKTGSHGYEVTEQGEEAEDDILTAVNSLSQTYPGTYGFVRNAASENTHDPFAEIAPQNSNQVPGGHYFQPASNPSFNNVQEFSSHNDPFQSPLPNQSIQPSEFSNEFDDANQVTSSDSNHLAGFSSAEDFNDENPTSFNREAGIQQIINTGGVETLTY